MKTLDPEMVTALNSGSVTLLTAASIEMSDTDTVYVHSAIGNFTIDGNEYIGVGKLGSMDAIRKDGGTSPEGLKMTMSGLDTTLLSDVMTDNYQGRPVIVYFCILTDNYETVHSHIIFKGRLNTMNILFGETATITIEVEDRLIDWQRGDTSRWNDASHKRTLPEGTVDKFFEYVEETVDKNINFAPYIPEP